MQLEALRRIFDLNALATGKDVEWTPWREGVAIHRLYGDGREGRSAALLRYEPNATVPLHEHVGNEHVFVLSGAQEDGAGVYPAGTMVVNPSGSRHRLRSREGCVVLVLWEQPVIFVDGP
jgi:anti-sigma factor ChrR (cupin superfamily)